MQFRRGASAGRFVAAAALASAAVCLGAAPTSKPSAAQRVTFDTEDGVLIVGDYCAPTAKAGERAPIAILLPMETSDRSAWGPLVAPLRAAGFAVLAIDLRGIGESVEPKGLRLREKLEKRDSKLFRAMHKDVAAAYGWLAKQGNLDAARFVLVGAGLGASVAMDYASRDRSVDAIVCLSPATGYGGLDSAAHIARCQPRAVLLVAARAESDAASLFQRAAPKATLRIVDEPEGNAGAAAAHGIDLLGKARDLERTIVGFLGQAAGRPGGEPVVATLDGEVYHAPGTSMAQRIKDENRRWFSSAEEAESRGLRPVKKRGSRGGGEAQQASPKPPNSPAPRGNAKWPKR